MSAQSTRSADLVKLASEILAQPAESAGIHVPWYSAPAISDWSGLHQARKEGQATR